MEDRNNIQYFKKNLNLTIEDIIDDFYFEQKQFITVFSSFNNNQFHFLDTYNSFLFRKILYQEKHRNYNKHIENLYNLYKKE
jgi:hypothetical protein